FMTNRGRVYRLKGYEIPEYGRSAKGLPIVNLLKLDEDEVVQTIIRATQAESEENYFFFVTRNGIIKRTKESEFAHIRQNGLKAITLKDGDELINVIRTSGDDDIIIGTRFGYSVRFKESAVRSMSRSASGVRGVNLREGDAVVGTSLITDDQEVLVITEKGYVIHTAEFEYTTNGRGGKGIKTVKITEKNGLLAGLATVNGDSLMRWFESSYPSYTSRRGGIGRRAGLKIQCPQGRAGSTPAAGIVINSGKSY